MKRFSYMNVTISCFVFAACFAVIPLYRTFCESVGISGDVDKKEYTFDATKSFSFPIKLTISKNSKSPSQEKSTPTSSGILNQ